MQGKQGQGQQGMSAMELVVGVLRGTLVHSDLGQPSMKVPALRAAIGKRLGGSDEWNKVLRFTQKHFFINLTPDRCLVFSGLRYCMLT